MTAADLRKMNIENTENLLSPRRGGATSTGYNPSVNFQSPRRPDVPSFATGGAAGGGGGGGGAPTNRSTASNDDPSFARGGHGIFGEPIVSESRAEGVVML